MSALRRAAALTLLLAGCGEGCSQGCGGGEAPPKAEATKRPNVLLMTLDTLRADALQIYGNTVAETPVLTQIAKEGVRFSRAYTVTPLTIPSHSSLFTGLYPPRHGVRDNGDFFLTDEAVTLAERLHDAGWATMASVGAEVTSHHWGFAQGFDAYFDEMGEADSKNRWRVERKGNEVVDDALGWLTPRLQQDEDQPWFAWVHLFDAHHPYEAPPGFAARFPNNPYLAEVGFVDMQVGRLMAALQESGALEDTWVIVMADHGEGLGDHGEAMHGVLLYNATTRIPLIMRPPGGRDQDVAYHFPVSSVDVLPTILELVGQPAPEDIDGRSIAEWVDPARTPPEAEPDDRFVYVESLYAWRHYGWAAQRAIVGKSNKLIDTTTPELYDRSDYFEEQNLAEQRPEEVKALQDKVAELAAELAAKGSPAEAAQVSDERMAQLEALGYLTGVSEAAAGEDGFGEGLPDPVERLPSLRRMEVARRALRAGQLEEALTEIDAVLAENPDLMQLRNMRAQVLSRMGRTEEALEIYASIDADRPSAQSRAGLGIAKLNAGELEEGLALLEDSLERDPYITATWGNYLGALLMSGRFSELESALARAKEAVPEFEDLLAFEGHLDLARGDVAAAKAAFTEALRRNPEQRQVNEGLAVIAYNQGAPDAAEAHLLEELRINPGALTSRRMLVALYAEQDRYAEQLEQLAVVQRAVPADPLNWHAGAQALFNLKRYDEAAQALDSCDQADPGYSPCVMLRANVLKKQGKDAEAQAAYERAVQMGPPKTQRPPVFPKL
ncbi:MAG: sulfatase-like hydrolase/transferase [Alphaproteobacteria bacterium]|nr:sulfatase-like hydrolase/transferase [Alphaproteobacteria bacterium]MCB9793986.1 sulfatase-like hydrolase/transferase [Alphaproteobacteria bacterium]